MEKVYPRNKCAPAPFGPEHALVYPTLSVPPLLAFLSVPPSGKRDLTSYLSVLTLYPFALAYCIYN